MVWFLLSGPEATSASQHPPLLHEAGSGMVFSLTPRQPFLVMLHGCYLLLVGSYTARLSYSRKHRLGNVPL